MTHLCQFIAKFVNIVVRRGTGCFRSKLRLYFGDNLVLKDGVKNTRALLKSLERAD